MGKTINVYWTRHGLSCSNMATAAAFRKIGCVKNEYKQVKKSEFTKWVEYPRDSFLTNIGKEHCVKIAEQLNINFDLILSSSLIRSIQTADEFSKNLSKCKDRNIYIVPYIQELGTSSNGNTGRTLQHLKTYTST